MAWSELQLSEESWCIYIEIIAETAQNVSES